MTRALRIITGLILFAFVTSHLLNQALGLHSLALMDSWRGFFISPWSNPVGGAILIGSLVLHGMLGMGTLYKRNTLNMAPADAIQFVSGFLILPLLVPHVVAINLGADLIPGYIPTFQGTLQYFWVLNPLEGLRQIFVVVIVWIHGAIGLLTWFRLKAWWSAYGKFINPLMVLVPVAALLGFVEAGKEVIAMSEAYAPASPSPIVLEALNTINNVKWTVLQIYAAMLVMVLIARWVRVHKNISQTNIKYLHGPQISGRTGLSLLELSIASDVPHANLCRGRGRCGTCQVRIVSSQNDLAPASALEQATLTRINAAPDIRLACQMIPDEGSLVVERIIPPYIDPDDLKNAFENTEAELLTSSEAGQ